MIGASAGDDSGVNGSDHSYRGCALASHCRGTAFGPYSSFFLSSRVPRMAPAGGIGLIPEGVNRRGAICTVGWDGMAVRSA